MFTGRGQGPLHSRCAVPLGGPSDLLPCVCIDLGGPLLLRCCEGCAGQTGTGQQRSGPSFVTSKLPVLLAVSGKLLLLCFLGVLALCTLPLSGLPGAHMLTSPCLHFLSASPSGLSLLLVSPAQYIILSLLFSKSTLIRGWQFPFLQQKTSSSARQSRWLCPQDLCLLGSAQLSGPFGSCLAQLKPWDPRSMQEILLVAALGAMLAGAFHIREWPLCTMLDPTFGK